MAIECKLELKEVIRCNLQFPLMKQISENSQQGGSVAIV